MTDNNEKERDNIDLLTEGDIAEVRESLVCGACDMYPASDGMTCPEDPETPVYLWCDMCTNELIARALDTIEFLQTEIVDNLEMARDALRDALQKSAGDDNAAWRQKFVDLSCNRDEVIEDLEAERDILSSRVIAMEHETNKQRWRCDECDAYQVLHCPNYCYEDLVTSDEHTQIKESFDILKQGRIVSAHADAVTTSMLKAYLNSASSWSPKSISMNGKLFWQHNNIGRVAGIAEEDDAPSWHIQNCIARIAEVEKRGELAVWTDIMDCAKEA